jgi:hypothetical protein
MDGGCDLAASFLLYREVRDWFPPRRQEHYW